ncbi:hypothetical protein D2E25_1735 [Bifidobacterium goeldii]|uniref:Acyltransferase 3 domain-containing protein n=2 Tax=Bifidobacterium goeldii TaxID=2306975 RepID=A0A430FG12_9BIFI|nr:hypothetical protein D2E25_1735 [Bifidobacterium goeldii]
MPLFFLLGGLTFSTRGGFKAFLIRKIRTLLIPYYIFSLYFLAKPFAILFIPNLRESFQTEHNYNIGHQFYDVLIMGNGLWFLMAFFVAELIMYGLTKIIRTPLTRILSGLLLIIGTYTLKIFLPIAQMPFQILKGIQIAGFMLIGLSIRNRLLHIKRRTATLLAIPNILMIIIIENLFSFRKNDIISNNVVYMFLLIIAALCGALGFTCLSIVIQHCSYLEYIGQNSLVYYSLNAITLNIVKIMLFHILGINVTASLYIIQLLIGIMATLLALAMLTIENYFINRYFRWSIGKK